MEFSIKVLVVIILAVIAFVVFVAMIGGFGQNASGTVKGLFDWFNQIITGKASIPAGGSNTGGINVLPGLPTVKPVGSSP